MNANELDAIVEAKLAAELVARHEADRQRVKMEVVAELRRAAERAHYAKINARHPIENQLSGLTPAQHEARLAAMSEGVRRDMARMDAANSKPIEGSLLYNKQQASLVPGSEGLTVRATK